MGSIGIATDEDQGHGQDSPNGRSGGGLMAGSSETADSPVAGAGGVGVADELFLELSFTEDARFVRRQVVPPKVFARDAFAFGS